MAQVFERDGQTFVLTEDGRMLPADRPGVMAQAGRQFADLGSGIQQAAGYLFDSPEWIAQAQADTAERNRIFEGPDLAYPFESMAGQALPALATAPISASSVLGSVGLNVGLGAAESALDIGQGGTAAQRATGGAMGGFLGDMGGRALGRILNMADGIAGAMAGRTLRGNAASREFEALGGETLAYQRMEPGTLGQRAAERATQGAKSSLWGAPQIKATAEANDALFRGRVAEAVGLNPERYTDLGPEFIDDALTRFSGEFDRIGEMAAQVGDLTLDERTARVLLKSPQIKRVMQLEAGFDGLENGVLSGADYVTARRALMEDASKAFDNGEGVTGESIMGLVSDLDAAVESRLPSDFLPEFARLREQYRVFNQIERPNVINADGQINPKSLNRVLRSERSGFGRTATRGADAVNPETTELLDLARSGARTGFQPFRSSGTAENLALDRAMDDVQQAVAGGGPGVLGMVAAQGAPLVTPLMEAGGGLPYDALLNQAAPSYIQAAGAGLGRAGLDEAFYPFVGAEDDRPR